MDSPHSGFRRAAVASWALAGLGVAGVAGASALAYADTVTPAPTEVPLVAIEPAAPLGSTPLVEVPTVPVPVVTTTDKAPTITPEATAKQPSVTTETPVPVDTPEQTHQRAPATKTRESSTPSTPPTTRRRTLTPATVMAPNYSPRLTTSRGS